jgi:hypothetical protein
MFWRFGSELERRPVAAIVWLKEVCTRPVTGSISAGSASTYVDLSFAICRYSRIFAGSGCSAASFVSTSTSVERPVFVFLMPFVESLSRSNRTSRSWIGEPMLNSPPASS